MHLSKWLREMHVSLSLCFVAVTERWHFIQVNGQGANTWKTPKGWKEWLWSNVLSSHVITPDSWSGRGENVGRCYGYWRKRGGWKEISDTVPRLDERRHFKERKKGKRKKSDRCSRESSCVGLSRHTLIDQVSHSLILGSKKRIHPTGHFHSHFRSTNRRRYHCLTPGPGNLEIGVSDLRPPRDSTATSRERKRWPIANLAQSRRSLIASVPRSNVVK